jgi:hypothetical protein
MPAKWEMLVQVGTELMALLRLRTQLPAPALRARLRMRLRWSSEIVGPRRLFALPVLMAPKGHPDYRKPRRTGASNSPQRILKRPLTGITGFAVLVANPVSCPFRATGRVVEDK